MKVSVTGYGGTFGKATADLLRRLGQVVVVYDIDPAQASLAAADGFAPRDLDEAVEINFLCVPEAQLDAALAALPTSPLTVLRATITPGTTDRLTARFNCPLAYLPEFADAETAAWDALNPSFVLIGANDADDGAVLAELFAPLLAPVIVVTPLVAEMVKITLNAYLYTLLSFWNEIHLICEKIGVPSHLVGKLAVQDPRVVTYGATMHGRAVRGRLPEDLDQLIEFANALECLPDLLNQVRHVNEKLASRPRAA